MTAFWVAFQAFVLLTAVPFIVHILKVFGIGLVVYTGASAVLGSAQDFLFERYDSMPLDLYSMLNLAGFDSGLKMVFAAYTANIALKYSAGSIKKFKFLA